MSKWQRKLVLQPEWGNAKERKIEPHVLAAVVAKRLRDLKPIGDDSIDCERDEIAEEFECLSEDKNVTFDDFDCVMEQLWNWGDTSLDGKFGGKKVCWIHTF